MLRTGESGRIIAASGLMAALATAPTAAAFCREVTASPPAGYDPVTTGCFDGGASATVTYWKGLCVNYSLQASASRQVSLADAQRVAARAFAAWTDARCSTGAPSIQAVEQVPVQCDHVPSEGHNNPIVFRDDAWPYDDSSNTLAFTTLTVDLASGEILGAAVEVNSHDHTLSVADSVPAGAFSLERILTHEAGHFLGLAHSDVTSALMYAHYDRSSAPLGPDDVAGLCAIYPPDGTRTTSGGATAAGACQATPVGGFATACSFAADAGAIGVATGDAASEPTGSRAPESSVAPAPRAAGCSTSGGRGSSGVAGLLAALGAGLAARRRARSSSIARRP